MPLQYKTGIATSPWDLLDELEDFCVTSNGWTKDQGGSYSYSYQDPGDVGVNGKQLHIHKTDSYGEVAYFHFYAADKAYPAPQYLGINYTGDIISDYIGAEAYGRSQIKGLAITGSKGYLGTGEWFEQTTMPDYVQNTSGTGMACMSYMTASALPYWMFAQGDSIHVVVEVITGQFQHMSFGTLVKSCTYTGGQYFAASQSMSMAMVHRGDTYLASDGTTPIIYSSVECPWSVAQDVMNGSIYCEVETPNYWGNIGAESDDNPGYATKGLSSVGIANSFETNVGANYSFMQVFNIGTPAGNSSLHPQCPLYARRYRSDLGDYTYLGYPEGIRYVNMKAITTKAENALGPDTWKIFPTSRKDPGEAFYSIGVPGLSYLKDKGT